MIKKTLIVLVITLVLAEIVARFIDLNIPLLPYRPEKEAVKQQLSQKRDGTMKTDPNLGWKLNPGYSSKKISINSQGIRAPLDHLYTTHPEKNTVRILTVGDSFTFGDDVSNEQTWQYFLEKNNKPLEVLNLGVPAYGSDQAYLLWKEEGKKYHPDIVILGIWPENIARNLNLFRYYLYPKNNYGAVKPRITSGKEVINSPVIDNEKLANLLSNPNEKTAILDYEYWFDPYMVQDRFYRKSKLVQLVESVYFLYQRKLTRDMLYTGENPEGINVTVAIAELFSEEVKQSGAIPIIMIIPMQDLLAMHTAKAPFPLVKALKERGLNVIDLGPTLGKILQKGDASYYTNTRHHSETGNRQLAHYLMEELKPWIDKVNKQKSDTSEEELK